MAKKPKGFYSVEAIQGRQQFQLDEYNRLKAEQVKSTPPEAPISAVRPQNAIPPVTVPKPSPTPPKDGALPYLAEAVDKYGLPYFGEGFKGWARKTFSMVFDPLNFEIDGQIKKDYETKLDKVAEKVEVATNWDDWGAKVFGLSTEEIVKGLGNVAAAGTTKKQELEEGEITKTGFIGEAAQTTLSTMSRFTFGNLSGAGVIMGGLQLFGMDDVAVRKLVATGIATERLGRKPNSKPSPINVFKYAAVGSNAAGMIKNLISGRITPDDIKDTYKSYWQGSQAIYTMVFDQMVQDEFNRQVEAGADPELTAQNLGNPLLELAGSIFLSPSTYLGLGVPERVGKFLNIAPEAGKQFYFFGKTVQKYHIPTFGQLLKIPTGSVKISQVANRLDDLTYINGLDNAVNKFAKAATENAAKLAIDEAATLISKAAERAATKVDNIYNGFGLVSYVNSSKISTTTREAKTVLSVIVKDAESVDDALLTMRDMVKVARNPEDKAAIARLMKTGKTPLTESGMFTGQLLAKMEDMFAPIMAQLMDAKKISKKSFASSLYSGIERVVRELVPSVEDMADARKAVRSGNFTAEQAQLAKMYDNIPGYAKASREISKYTDPARKMGVNFMSNVYMNLSPGYFSRNILSQSVNIFADMGLDAAIEISAKSYKGIDGVVGSNRWTQKVVELNNQRLEKLLGFIPEAAQRAIGNTMGDIRDATKTKKGFLNAAQNAELIASSEIVLRSARNEVMKALPAAIDASGWDGIAQSLPKEQVTLLYKLLTDNIGDFDDAIADFRKAVGKGEIDAWRLIPVPPKLMNTLDDLKQGNAFKNLIRTAKTQNEFTMGVSKIMDNIDAQAKNVFKEAQTVGGVSEDAIKNLVVDSQTLYGEGDELFRRKVMYWENARIQIKNGVGRARDSLNLKMSKRPELKKLWNVTRDRLEAIQNTEYTVYQDFDNVRREVRKIVKNFDQPIEELAENAVYGKRWSLKQEFPDVDWKNVTREEFTGKVWESYFNYAKRYWRDWNLKFFDDQLSELENFSQTAFQQGLDAAVSTNKGDDNPFKLAFEYRNIANKLEAFGKFEEGDTVATLAGKFNIKDKAILNTVNKYSGEKYSNIADIPLDIARKAFEERSKIKGFDLPYPAAYNGEQPTLARSLWESAPGIRRDLKSVEETVLNDWGKKVQTFDAGMEDVISSFGGKFKENMKTVQTKAGLYANAARDFILHDYEKTYLDLAMSYLMPFQYWTTRTYGKFLERFVENPSLINQYFNFKEYMTKEHADLPEWWRYNVEASLPGIEDSPLFFNLEATLNPLYGLMGTDFNDPYKRVDWISSMVDDMNKAGPTLAPIYSWAVALHLYNKGEDDAAQRWMGRLFPQTALLKTILTKSGANVNIGGFVKNNEFDPFVNFLMDGLDAYERNRIARHLAGLEGKEVLINGKLVNVTAEMAIQASADQKGELWEYAMRDALNERTMGQTFSFLFGVGFKSRNQGDLKVDEFYNEYHKLISARSLMPAEEYNDEWAKLREKYPFMDAVLISKKAGSDRDTALAYNVLSRIPPGELSDMAETLGIQPYMLEQFYSNKGDFSAMNSQDKDRFMAAIMDMSAMLKMPDYPTKAEWNMAKAIYKEMNDQLSQQYGENIHDKVGMFYDLPENERELFLEANPDVAQAMDAKTAMITNTPILSAYYGGIDTIERYYTTLMNEQLDEEFGEDVALLFEEYYFLKDSLKNEEAKAFYNANNLKSIESKKKKLQAEVNKAVVESGKLLPEMKGYEIRPDFMPASGYQEDALNVATGNPQAEAAQAIWSGLTPEAQSLIQEYLETGEKLPSGVMRQLDYLAGRQGMSQYDALRLLEIEEP